MQVYDFDECRSAENFKLLWLGRYSSRSLTQVTSIKYDQSQLIVATATDGKLVLWKLPQVGEQQQLFPKQDPIWTHAIHQNAITSMSCTRSLDVPFSSRRELFFKNARLLITVGDDNAVALTLLHPPFLTRISPEDTRDQANGMGKAVSIRIPHAHAASVNAVIIIAQGRPDNGGPPSEAGARYWVRLATAGKDQRIRLWDISIPIAKVKANEGDFDMSLAEIRRAGRIYTQVADVASMELMDPLSQERRNENSIVRVLVVGVGMEVLEVEAGRPSV